MNRTGLATAIVVSAIFLAGCTAPPANEPTQTPEPTVEPVVQPGSRIPFDCTEAVAQDAVESFLGEPADLAPLFVNYRAGAVIFEQQGVLGCSWRTDTGNAFTVLILASDESVFTYRWENGTADTVAASSQRRCALIYSRCDIQFFHAGYNVDLVAYREESGTDLAEMEAAIDTIGSALATHLESAPALPGWEAPEVGTVERCDDLDPAGAVANAFPENALQGPEATGSGDGFTLYYIAAAAAGALECSWYDWGAGPNGLREIQLEFVPGSAWSWDSLTAGATEKVTVAGASKAVSVCDNYACTVHALVSQTWMRLQVRGDGVDGVAEAIHALEAFIPVLPVAAP
jgi:hypothetical protein